MHVSKLIVLIACFCIVATSCDKTPNGNSNTSDTFDRSAMLVHWADNIITPAFENYSTTVQAFADDVTVLTSTPSQANLQAAKDSWLAAYTSYQMVAMYEIGPAQTLNFTSRQNIYPTDIALIEGHLTSDTPVNLDLPSMIAAQGYPAVEYILFGQESEEVIANLETSTFADHLILLATQMSAAATQIHSSWSGDYRDTFVSQDGSSATASVNLLTNAYVEYFERQLRANKVGIPAGVFSLDPLPTKTEGRYAKGVSKQLFVSAIDAFQQFFIGRYNSDSIQGDGFSDYLAHLQKSEVADKIELHLNNARAMASALSDDFGQQVLEDNTKMTDLYDELNKVVVLLKVDMMQALNIKITYVDADGD